MISLEFIKSDACGTQKCSTQKKDTKNTNTCKNTPRPNMPHAVKSPWNIAILPVSQHPGGFCHLREQHFSLSSPRRLLPHLHMAWHHHQTCNPSKLFSITVVIRTYSQQILQKTSNISAYAPTKTPIFCWFWSTLNIYYVLNLLSFIFSTLPGSAQKIRLARPQLPPWDFDLTKVINIAISIMSSCHIMSYKICAIVT